MRQIYDCFATDVGDKWSPFANSRLISRLFDEEGVMTIKLLSILPQRQHFRSVPGRTFRNDWEVILFDFFVVFCTNTL